MHVEDLLPADLCLVTLLISEQCSQFERFRLRYYHVQNIQLKKLPIIPTRAELTAKSFGVYRSRVLSSRLDVTNYSSANYVSLHTLLRDCRAKLMPPVRLLITSRTPVHLPLIVQDYLT